jgi:hypothetical protein
MILLEKQVCSLELCRRLKELGVKQESVFWWVVEDGGYTLIPEWQSVGCIGISAFTVAELGEMLPHHYFSRKDTANTYEPRVYDSYGIYHIAEDGILVENMFADTEADARAKMLICLVETKMVIPS